MFVMSAGQALGQAFGRLGGAASKFFGRPSSARAMAIGGLAGGVYGAFSDNTSVIGGMMGGAALGLGARYGLAGYKSGLNSFISQINKKGMTRLGAAGQAASAALRTMGRMSAVDIGRSRLLANRAIGKIPGLGK